MKTNKINLENEIIKLKKKLVIYVIYVQFYVQFYCTILLWF
jgi:hypothetical protein